jgi:hypothetical protein
VGVSCDSKKFGHSAYRELKAKGYHLIPVNPKADSIENDLCYPNLGARPERVGGALEGYPPLTYRNHSRGYPEHPLLH